MVNRSGLCSSRAERPAGHIENNLRSTPPTTSMEATDAFEQDAKVIAELTSARRASCLCPHRFDLTSVRFRARLVITQGGGRLRVELRAREGGVFRGEAWHASTDRRKSARPMQVAAFLNT